MKPTLAPRRAMIALAPGQILRPVVALDVDGTQGYYHEHFYNYAEGFLQRELPDQWDGSTAFWRSCGVSKATYREMKLGYRQGRLKRSMPVVPGAPELARAVRAAGAEVWVCTTRPYLRLDNIDPDTRWWLRHNSIQYDGVLYGDSKYRDLGRLVGSSRVVGVLDDDGEQVRRANAVGLPGFIIDRPYNQKDGNLERVPNLQSASELLVGLISIWKAAQGI